MHELTIFCIFDSMHCNNEFVSRNLSFAIFEGLSYEYEHFCCLFYFMHIKVGAYSFHDGFGCAVRCVCARFSRLLWLWYVNTPIDLYSAQNWLTHSLYNKDYETLEFSLFLSLFHFFSGVKQPKEEKNRQQHRGSNVVVVATYFLAVFFRCCCCCGYIHTTLAQRCGTIKLPNKK